MKEHILILIYSKEEPIYHLKKQELRHKCLSMRELIAKIFGAVEQ